jgi:hypothetical protein
MSPKVLNELHSEVITNGKTTFILNVFIIRKYEKYDASTKTRYHRDHLVGKIVKKQKNRFWFGHKEETLFTKSFSSFKNDSCPKLISILNEQVKKYL